MKYYSTKSIDKKNAVYNVIFGERSNGKTFALLEKGLKSYAKTGEQMAYIRRWKEDITGRRASQLFAGINESGIVTKITNGEFSAVHYYNGKYYMCNYDDKGKAIFADTDIICFLFALSDTEHNKSTSYPNVTLVIFDEFLTSKLYLNEEFVLFMNTISTIVRKREDVKIYMLGNTVNKYSPYFAEMGLEHIQKMKQGTIDLYQYGSSSLTVAVEYCQAIDSGDSSGSHKYFAFNNPKLAMITGGAWELNIYPHLPMKYKPKNIYLTYFIVFNDNVYQCEIIGIDEVYFTYIHIKTTELKGGDDLIYSLDYNPKPNYTRSIYKPKNKIQKKILWFFENDKVFYQDNNIGDSITNYLKICKGLR